MLELAVKKLGEVNPFESDQTVRAKKMLQKCAHAMISQQELSAQQVASYLMDFEDHFTSHSYRNLCWTAFEAFINKELPSPECYPDRKPKTKPDTPDGTTSDDNGKNDSDGESDDDEDSENEDESPFLNDLAQPDHSGHACINDDDQEISVSVNGQGNLVPAGSQLADYQMRGAELSNVCVWDFISRVDKIKKTYDRRNLKPKSDDFDEQEDDLMDQNESHENAIDDDAVEEDDEPKCSIMEDDSIRRPRVDLQTGHEQAKTHILRVRSPDDILVPVPIGPGIPRRDMLHVLHTVTQY
jgi:hypothetical protein